MRQFAAITILFLLSAAAQADHAPEWLVSKAPAEHSLFGVEADGLTLADLEAKFGKPDRSTTDSPDEAAHEWDIDGVTFWVATMFPEKHAGAAGENVHAIRIAGKQSARARTGAGVRLGGRLGDLIKAYGDRYQTEELAYMSGSSATVVFEFADGTELSAGFSDAGEIISLQLAAPVE